MGKPIVVGMPLPPDHKVDARILTTIERWDRTDYAETFYAATAFPTLGRDKIVAYAEYRRPAPTHILFIDSDVLPRHNTLDKLLELDKDIVTGVYPMTTKTGMTWSVAKDDEKMIEIGELPDNPFKVKHCGFGVMLVKYKVFEKLEWPYWKNEFEPGQIVKGEDIYFCDKVNEAGFDIWCEPKVKCNHIRMTNLMSIVNKLKGNSQ
jgi:GT2 family glycosyltransferase